LLINPVFAIQVEIKATKGRSALKVNGIALLRLILEYGSSILAA
jgi:hypothetical protein